MKSQFLTYIIATILFITSCKSPLDIDTPREWIPIDGEGERFSATLTSMEIKANDNLLSIKSFSCTLQADTTLNYPIFWLNLSLETDKDEINNLKLNFLDMKIDSLYNKDSVLKITGSQYSDYWSKYKILRGININSDTTIFSDKFNNKAEIAFSLNKEKREIWANLYSKLFSDKIWKEYKDTIYIDTIIKITYDTIWTSTTTWEKIIERKDTSTKERAGTIEIEQRALDSILLNGLFKFKY